MTDIERRLDALKRAVDSLYDDRIRQRRMLADLLYNLDEENMPVIKTLIEHYQGENATSLAALTLRADENGAAIESVAAMQTEQAESIASISQQADANGAQIAIAVERAEAAEGAASEANANVSNGAYIIARVNEDGSDIRISADKLELYGYTTFSDLENEGQTVINGANIKTGTLSVGSIEVSPNNGDGISVDKQTLFPNGIFFGDDVVNWHLLESRIKAITEDGINKLKIFASQVLELSAGSGNLAAIVMYEGNIDGASPFRCDPGGGSLAGYWTYNGSQIATAADLEELRSELGGSGGESGGSCSDGHTLEYISNDDNASHTVRCTVCGEILNDQEYCTDDGTGYCYYCGQFIV